MTREVWTDGDGKAQARAEREIEHVLADHVGRGLLKRNDVDGARQTLRAYAAARLNGAPSVNESAYLDFARATGVLNAIDDPRVRPSWAR